MVAAAITAPGRLRGACAAAGCGGGGYVGGPAGRPAGRACPQGQHFRPLPPRHQSQPRHRAPSRCLCPRCSPHHPDAWASRFHPRSWDRAGMPAERRLHCPWEPGGYAGSPLSPLPVGPPGCTGGTSPPLAVPPTGGYAGKPVGSDELGCCHAGGAVTGSSPVSDGDEPWSAPGSTSAPTGSTEGSAGVCDPSGWAVGSTGGSFVDIRQSPRIVRLARTYGESHLVARLPLKHRFWCSAPVET